MLTLHLFIVVCVCLVGLVCHGFFSSNVLPAKNTPTRKHFLLLAVFAQHIHSLGLPLVRDLQETYTNMETSLSCKASGSGHDPGKFNFGLGTEGGGQQAGGSTGGGSGTFTVLAGK